MRRNSPQLNPNSNSKWVGKAGLIRALWVGSACYSAFAVIRPFLPQNLFGTSGRGVRYEQEFGPAGGPMSSLLSSHSTLSNPLARSPASQTGVCGNFYKAICRGRDELRDPTGVVRSDAEGERRALSVVEEISSEHPDWSGDQIAEMLIQKIYTPERRERIEKAYEWVQTAMFAFVEQQPTQIFSSFEKDVLREKIRNLKLDLPDPATGYADEPDLVTKSGVFYERLASGETRIRIGGAYVLTASSYFNLVFTMAHEIAHSFDPCELKNENRRPAAYQELTSCFIRTGLVAVRKDRAECGENDQLSETFADWMAAQITGEAIARFTPKLEGIQLQHALANSVRDLCEQEDSLNEADVEYYPPPQVRIEGIFGRNPAIQRLAGCQAPDPNTTPAFVPALAASGANGSTAIGPGGALYGPQPLPVDTSRSPASVLNGVTINPASRPGPLPAGPAIAGPWSAGEYCSFTPHPALASSPLSTSFNSTNFNSHAPNTPLGPHSANRK